MDSPVRNREKFKSWINDRRNQSLIIGVLVLAALVLLQVRNLEKTQPTVQLFADCDLRSHDLHRMQIALSKSGLKEFEVADHQLFVPKQHQAIYLQALADQNALPAAIKEKGVSSSLSNPFLSHTQQVSIQRESRNLKLQELINLLPFVEQAWFEMDEPIQRSSFHPLEKSAVVTVRPKNEQALIEQNVYTIRQMVCGAISDLNHERIVIVDLQSGFAWRGPVEPGKTERFLDAQRAAFAKQQMIESRLQDAIQAFPGVRVTVVMESDEDLLVDKTALVVPDSRIEAECSVCETSLPSTQLVTAGGMIGDDRLAGANGQVSLSVFEQVGYSDVEPKTVETETVGWVNFVERETVRPDHVSLAVANQVTVVVDVPSRLALSRGRKESSSATSYRTQTGRPPSQTVEAGFNELKSEMDRLIRPIVARLTGGNEVEVVYNLIPETAVAEKVWVVQVREALSENWPSIVVLLVGVVLISMVTYGAKTKPVPASMAQTEIASDIEQNLISMKAPASEDDAEAAKQRLSQMIQNDPDTAAKVIENWIRDAA